MFGEGGKDKERQAVVVLVRRGWRHRMIGWEMQGTGRSVKVVRRHGGHRADSLCRMQLHPGWMV